MLKKIENNSAVKLLTTRVVYHTLFWLILLIIFLFIEGFEVNFWFTLSNELINLFFYALIVYFNLFYLIPKYLSQKKFLLYTLLLIVSIIVLTPLKVMVLFFKFSGYETLQASLVRNQNLYFLSTFIIAGSSTIFSIITDWGRQLKVSQDIDKEKMQSELLFLKSQINPHFLFNTLNNLYALTLKKSNKAPEIVIKLSEMMRYMLYECNEKYVLLTKEISHIRNYLDLERLRQANDVDITFEVEGQAVNQKIAPLMFITFLENCFKHGLSHRIEDGFVHVNMIIEGFYIEFHVVNSKPTSMPAQNHRRSGGIGLVNVRRRLDLLYNEKYMLNIEDKPNIYSVKLQLRLD